MGCGLEVGFKIPQEILFLFLAASVACESSQARDLTLATAAT